MSEQKCPKCGAEYSHDSKCWRHYACNTAVRTVDSVKHNFGDICVAQQCLENQVAKLTNHVDLMTDEFKRIKSCPGVSDEIIGLCNRAIQNTHQHVDVIIQRDNAETQRDVLKRALEMSEAKRAIVYQAALDGVALSEEGIELLLRGFIEQEEAKLKAGENR